MLDPTIRWTDRLQSSSGEWSGNLCDFYFRVYNKIIKDIKTPFAMDGGDRIDDTSVHKAIREALANCLINTDYYGTRGVVIKKEPDRLILENPGYIRTGKVQMRKGRESDPRNKSLMKMFNRYKGKSERGQVFTPDHITSFMYRLLNVSQSDIILDAACGSGAFLVKSMCNMIKEAGGINTDKALEIKSKQLYGIEVDREIYALACANMLIHKDGKTNLEQLDTRKSDAAKWIRNISVKLTGESQPKGITKVLMNPPFERAYGCMAIVKNVLDNVPIGTKCAFILPDKKLEKRFIR